jgi:hypothetical protein
MSDLQKPHDSANEPTHHHPGDPLTTVIVKGLDLARQPMGVGSIVVTLTLCAITAITVSHSDIATMTVGALAAFAIAVVACIALVAGMRRD